MWRSLIIALVFLAALAAGDRGVMAQTGFDRPGGDYSYVPLRSGDPAACAAACDRDRKCKAWTFSYPATVGDTAICWLKNQVTRRVANTCCVSGVRGTGVVEPRTGVVEFSTDRFGGDYRFFELQPQLPVTACQRACEADGRCRAWTYLRPGYGGPAARCYLKDRITPPRRQPCCLSGVVR